MFYFSVIFIHWTSPNKIEFNSFIQSSSRLLFFLILRLNLDLTITSKTNECVKVMPEQDYFSSSELHSDTA